VAILLAAGHRAIQLVGITTVAGNQTLDRTTLNACAVCTVGCIETVPVVPGCDRPLLRPLLTAAVIHGPTGLDGPPPVEPKVKPEDAHAVDFIREAVMARPGEITLVAVGPLTNLAVALRREPRIESAVREVVIMGGSAGRGNVTPTAEFNVAVDPEAAAIVFSASWPLTMMGLDVTNQALCTEDVQKRIAAIGTPAGTFVDQLMTYARGTYRAAGRMADPPVHDACAVAYVADPSVIEVVPALVQVETSGHLTSGATFVELAAPAARHRVGMTLRAERFWETLVTSIQALG
jgi:inosine-uridine nucleoside N-ribohydrolase